MALSLEELVGFSGLGATYSDLQSEKVATYVSNAHAAVNRNEFEVAESWLNDAQREASQVYDGAVGDQAFVTEARREIAEVRAARTRGTPASVASTSAKIQDLVARARNLTRASYFQQAASALQEAQDLLTSGTQADGALVAQAQNELAAAQRPASLPFSTQSLAATAKLQPLVVVPPTPQASEAGALAAADASQGNPLGASSEALRRAMAMVFGSGDVAFNPALARSKVPPVFARGNQTLETAKAFAVPAAVTIGAGYVTYRLLRWAFGG